MKSLKKITVIILGVIVCHTSSSQDLKLSAYTTPGPDRSDIGGAIGLLLPGAIGDIEVGTFYEKNGDLNKAENADSYSIASKDYAGLYSTMYLVGNEKLGFGVNMRGGVYDTKKFIITFAALAEYYVNPNLALGVSARFISDLPKVEARVSFNLAGGSRRRKRQLKYAQAWDQYRNQR